MLATGPVRQQVRATVGNRGYDTGVANNAIVRHAEETLHEEGLFVSPLRQ